MVPLQFRDYAFNIQQDAAGYTIFDTIRRKWLRLTPEEWVRQNMIRYLVEDKNYPAALFSLEKELLLGTLKKRCDMVVYRNDVPWMIVECKEQQHALTEAVLLQVLRYHMALPAEYLVITNGAQTYAWHKQHGQLHEITALPDYHP